MLVLVASFLFDNKTFVEAATSGWSQVGFAGSNVSFVGVNPYQQAEVLAVVDGQTKLTLDGGLLWQSVSIPDMVRSLAFDPVNPDVMYVGTYHGVYRSADRGASWQIFGSSASQVLEVTSVTVNTDAIFTTESLNVGNGFEEVFRIERSGKTNNVDFPTPFVRSVVTDTSNDVLYASSIGPIYRSRDSGTTWEVVADVPTIGSFASSLSVQNGQIWETSPSGAYESDNSGVDWKHKAAYPEVDELYPGTGTHTPGLAVNGTNAFFGLSETFYKVHEVYEVGLDAPTRLNFPDYPNVIAAGNQELWVAGSTGLWRRDGLVKNQSQIKRPLVVIPGTMGSWSVLGKWELDPITHTYDNLMKTLAEEGYVKGVTLFDFPYNWRADNNDSAHLLAEKIAGIKLSCQCKDVDVIGHSQGGLVARAYIESNYYLNDVTNLVELGTPNAGSVEDYSIWEAGVSVDQNKYLRIALQLFNIEAREKGFSDITTYVHTSVPSIRQLLPNYSYIKRRQYPNGYPLNSFLDELNAPKNLDKLKERTNLYIVGSDQKKTLTGLEVTAKALRDNWPEGFILNKFYGLGDGTVPISSLTSIASPNLLENETHGDLAKHPSQIWLQHLLGDMVPKPGDTTAQINRLMLVYVESPVRISITDPYGLQINDSADQVEGAFYTGSNEQVQFATIPMPLDGTYKINLTGKGSGKYTVGVSVFDDENGDSNTEQTGITNLGQVDSYVYDSTSTFLKHSPSSATNQATYGSDLSSIHNAASFVDAGSIARTTISRVIPKLATKATGFNYHGKPEATSKRVYEIFTLFLVMFFGTIAALWLHKKKPGVK